MSENDAPRIALVTGASRGIGRAIAEALAADGCHVICVSRSAASAQPVVEAIQAAGGKAEACPVDVADAAAIEAAAASLLATHGTIDVLVNNAGITRDGLLFRMSTDDWESVLATNLSSCFHWIKHLARPMTRKRRGRIVNIASVVGLTGNAGQANYAAAKAGMIGMSKALAKEFAGRNVTVNVVAPGFIETDMTAELSDDQKAEAKAYIPLKRFGRPEDISTMVSYLCSDAAGYVTGQVFTVDGGMVM
ncbi:MAG: 3-oxoacyl-[acyl-carrier-protein] reductase [Opitutales bacterium]